MIRFITLFLLSAAVHADWDQYENNQMRDPMQPHQGEYTLQDRGTGEILQIRPNTYGPGVSSDQYGRAIKTDPTLRVTPDAYGPGIGMDQYGRPVR